VGGRGEGEARRHSVPGQSSSRSVLRWSSVPRFFASRRAVLFRVGNRGETIPRFFPVFVSARFSSSTIPPPRPPPDRPTHAC
jgi:hypothetical protein